MKRAPRSPQRLVVYLVLHVHKARLKLCRGECFTSLLLAPASQAARSLTLVNVCRAAPSAYDFAKVYTAKKKHGEDQRGLFMNKSHHWLVYSLD